MKIWVFLPRFSPRCPTWIGSAIHQRGSPHSLITTALTSVSCHIIRYTQTLQLESCLRHKLVSKIKTNGLHSFPHYIHTLRPKSNYSWQPSCYLVHWVPLAFSVLVFLVNHRCLGFLGCLNALCLHYMNIKQTVKMLHLLLSPLLFACVYYFKQVSLKLSHRLKWVAAC